MNNFDLHMHSCYSGDGQFTPEELIKIAKERGLKTIALSDHDCISGVKDMIQLGLDAGIEVIPAIECSTSIGYSDVHLLGYGIDIDNEYFIKHKLSLEMLFQRVVISYAKSMVLK